MPPPGFRSVGVFLTAEVQPYIARMGAAVAATRQLGREVHQVGSVTAQAAAMGDQSMKRLGQAGVIAGGLIAGALVAAGAQAVTFEARMRNVATISETVRDDFGAAGEQVLDMSRRFPQGADVLAAGLYDIASSGFAGAEGFTVLRSSALAASAGLTTTAVAAKGITAVLNAYGLSARNAADVSDIMFQTVNLGVLTFEELSSNIGDVVGSAAAAGVAFDEVGAGMATITLSGISAAEASTSLNRVLQSLIDPSEAMTALLRELGYESGIAALDALGLQGVMELLRKATGGNIEQLVKLFPEIRAARGALALMANEGQNAERVFEGITNVEERAGATQAAYNEQQKSTAVQLQLTRASLEAFGIEMGQRFLPAVRSGAGLVQSLSMGMADLPDGVVTATTAVAGLSAIVLTLGGGYLVMAPKIKAAKDLMDQMSVSSQSLARGLRTLSVVAGVATAALAVGAVGLALYTDEKRKAREQVEEFVGALRAEAEGTEAATRKLVAHELFERQAVGTLEDLGIETRTATDAILGNQQAVDSLAESLLDTLPAGLRTAEMQDLLSTALNGSDKALRDVRARLLEQGVAYDRDIEKTLKLVGVVGGLSDAHTDARVEIRELTEAEKDAGVGADETRSKMAQLDAMFRTTADGAAELTDRQRDIARTLEDFFDPVAAYKSALDDKTSAEKRSYGDGGDAAEEAMRRQERALEETIRIRQRALEDQLDAERAAYDERRRLRDSEIDAERKALEARFRGIDRGLDDERDLLDEQSSEQARAFEDRRTELERRHRIERDALQRGVYETQDAFSARKDALEAQQQVEKDAFEDEKRLADRRLEDRRRELDERTQAARRNAEDEKAVLDVRLDAERVVLDEEKRLMDERQAATKRALEDKDRAEKEQLESLKETHKQGSKAWNDFSDDVSVTVDEYMAKLRQNVADMRDWARNLATIAARVGPDVALHLMKLGSEAAPLVGEFARGTQAQVDAWATEIRGSFGRTAEAVGPILEAGLVVAAERAKQGTGATVQSVADALRMKAPDVRAAAEFVGVSLIDGMLAGIVKQVAGSRDVFRNWDPARGYTGPAMMAEGGVLHRQQVKAMVSSMPTVVFGEARGSESYIPHHPAYRSTAVPVLHDTARALGFRAVPMANGGMVGPSTPIASLAPWQSGSTVAPIDYVRLGEAVASALLRAGVGSVYLDTRSITNALAPPIRERIRRMEGSQR